MNAFAIKPADAGDIMFIVKIVCQSFQDVAERLGLTPENCPKHPSNYSLEWAQSDVARGVQFFLLWEEETPVGAVALEQPQADLCYLERLSVLPDYRKKGYGEALVRRIFLEAKNRGAQELSIAIVAAQTDLRLWYEKLGFRAVLQKRFDHLPFEVLFMRHELSRDYAITAGLC